MKAMLRLDGIFLTGNNALLRAMVQISIAADAGFGDTIPFFLVFRPTNGINLTEDGLQPKLKYSMVKSFNSKMMPIFRVSPGYTLARYGCSVNIVLIFSF